jgi:2-dehydro-3-deoxyphosphogluconate aldolase/(4S)-4-hydroxy-2-oxoglutarate aldolase
MTPLTTLLGSHRVIPVIVIDDATQASPLADALVRGGLPIAEITFRTAAAPDALRSLAGRDDLVAGAGSVRTADQVDEAVAAGARFVVSPGLSERVVERCREHGVPVLPGVATASEIMRALDLGLDVVKLFPAGAVGGPGAVRDLSGPFPGVRFVPTGGVGPANVGDYLSLPSVVAVGGSWMVAVGHVRSGRFDEVERSVAEAVAAAGAVAR